MRHIALLLVVVASMVMAVPAFAQPTSNALSAEQATATARLAKKKPIKKRPVTKAKLAVCTASVVPSQTKGRVTFTGKCKLGKKTVPSSPHFVYKTEDQWGYTCMTRAGTTRGKTLKVSSHNGYTWSGYVTYIPKNKKLKFKGRHATFEADLGGNVMCGKPGDKNPQTGQIPTTRDVCAWGSQVDGGNGPYCGVVYYFKGAPKLSVPQWDLNSFPSGDGTIQIGHFVSPGGICTAKSYGGNPPPDSWYHTDGWNYWQCGGLVVETTFSAWLTTPSGKRCPLPDDTQGEGVMSLQVSPDKVSGTLQIDVGMTVSTGKLGYNSAGVAHDDATAELKLPGNAEGCPTG